MSATVNVTLLFCAGPDKAVVVSSSCFPEILAGADRILIADFVEEFDAASATEDKICGKTLTFGPDRQLAKWR